MALANLRLLDESPVLIAVLDARLKCIDLSPGWRTHLGIDDSAADDIGVEDLIDTQATPGIGDLLESILAEGEPIRDRRVELPGAEGSAPGRLAAWRAVVDATSTPQLVIAVSDTGEIEAAMRDLTRVQTQHQLILSAAGEGIYGLDADGNLTFGNDATYEILGWRVNDILGHKAHDVHHHSHVDGSPYPREQCPIYAALKDGEVHRVDDEVFWHTDGSAVPVEYTSTPIIKDGKPAGAVVVFREISERKEIERQREEAYEEIRLLKDQLEQERDYLRDEIDVTVNFGEIIGESPALKRTLAKVEAVAATDANVLVLGESGVGKEMIARAIHVHSPRCDKALIKVNCASVPKDLFESEFFGHVKGAFTGAHRDRVGRIQLANCGTLFLDEVGEIPLSLQSKLLRVLQEREFERVGDDHTVRVDVRVVAATNRNLEEEVAAGRFREDLYYRLSVFPIELPPLRDRPEDIVPLATHFLQCICKDLGREAPRLTKQQISLMLKRPWPGNVRELRNILERAVILTRGSRLNLEPALGQSQRISESAAAADESETDYMTEEEFSDLERRNLLAVLEASDWQVWGEDGAAAKLGVKPSTFSYRMNAFGIRKNDGR